jgi:hypothetical protein
MAAVIASWVKLAFRQTRFTIGIMRQTATGIASS